MISLLVIAYFSVIWLGLRFQKSTLAFRIIFVMAWLMIAGNYYNADYDNYLHKYEVGNELSIDIGFGLICQFFKNLGFHYLGFKAIVSFVCLWFIFNTISRLSNKKALYASLFLLITFIVDITQFRNFVAYSIVYYAILNLFFKTRFSNLKFILLILIAASIHATSIFCLFFILAKFELKWWHIAVGVYIMASLKLFVTSEYQLLFETQKVDVRETPTIAGALFTAMPMLIFSVLFYYCDKYGKTYDAEKIRIWKNISMLMLLVIPLYFINTNFSRLFRNMVILNMLFFYDYLTINRIWRSIFVLAGAVFFTVNNYFSGSYFELVFMPAFRNNLLINII